MRATPEETPCTARPRPVSERRKIGCSTKRLQPSATRDDVLDALAGHVCRCTGYVKIVDAVEAAIRGDVKPEEVEPSYEPEEVEVLIPGSPA